MTSLTRRAVLLDRRRIHPVVGDDHSSDCALRTVSSDERRNFVESISPTVVSAASDPAFKVSASALRDVVSPCSSVMPAAEMNASRC